MTQVQNIFTMGYFRFHWFFAKESECAENVDFSAEKWQSSLLPRYRFKPQHITNVKIAICFRCYAECWKTNHFKNHGQIGRKFSNSGTLLTLCNLPRRSLESILRLNFARICILTNEIWNGPTTRILPSRYKTDH